MKLFKRLSAIALSLSLCFLSACLNSGTSINTNMFAGSYWLKSAEVSGIGGVNEVCVYNVTFDPITPEEGKDLLTADMQGTLTTTLVTSTYNGVDCYKFSTEISITGTYYYGTKSAEINDIATSECYFGGIGDKFSPLYSKKYSISTIPLISTVNDTILFEKMEYSVESVYDKENNVATVSVIGGDKSTEGFKVETVTKEYEKYLKSGNVVDNESLLFIPRAADFGENGFSSTFYRIDALKQKIEKMSLAVSSSAPTSEIELKNYQTSAGTSDIKLPVYNATISINDKFSGSAKEFYYATDITTQHRRLVQIKTQVAYEQGYMVYTLSSVNYQA